MSQYCTVWVKPIHIVSKSLRKDHRCPIPKIDEICGSIRGIGGIRCLGCGETLTGVKALFRVCGCYRRLVKKTLHLGAINKGPNKLAASSITEPFQIIDVFYLTPLINVLDGLYGAVPFHVSGSHEYVSRIFFSDLGDHSRTVTCLRTELAEIKKPGSSTHKIRVSFDE
ncbi:hypothetical protein BDR22DRAFT_887099 [Usnea florida]